MSELIQTLKPFIVQHVDGKRLQVEEVGMRWMSVGKNEMLERESNDGLGSEPSVGYCVNDVLRWERLEDWNGEYECLNFVVHNLMSDND